MKLKHIFISAALALVVTGCNFLEVPPTGMIDDNQAYAHPDELVNAAYSSLGADWFNYPFNLWPYGDVAADDALKGGGDPGDVGGYHHFEIWSSLTTTPGEMDELWYRLYVAISRSNRALIALQDNGTSAGLDEKTLNAREAEVRFLRAHFYFKLVQVFYQVPWIDEEVVRTSSHETTTNDETRGGLTHDQLMQKIVDDFKFAYDNLKIAGPGVTGRATKEAAAAYLAKVYLTWAYGDGYEATTGYNHVNTAYMDSVYKYTGIVAGAGYDYAKDFGDLFMIEGENKNGCESVFAVQHSDYTEDNTVKGRANWSNMLNGARGIWSMGHDFHKPSQNLVNAFKTKNGLPMFDDFDADHNTYPVNGAPTAQKWDPRLFHTVAMPTFPYKYESAYTFSKDNARNPATYGYYNSLKEVQQRSKGESFDDPWQHFTLNDYVIRYTEVMLWRAEACIELNKTGEALTIINDIRNRAKASVNKYIGYAANQCDIAAYDDLGSQDDARRALRWETRLELAMEHERFFALRRWGMLSQTMAAYFKSEQTNQYDDRTYAEYYKDAFFTTEKNEYWPIPYNQLYYVPGLYKANKGYN